MTSITQTIPNYVAGISQQPDQFKNPGQVSDALNVVPSIQTGLVKRPGSAIVTKLDYLPENKSWFHYYRDQVEQYIGCIARGYDPNNNLVIPTVRLWNVRTGEEAVVTQPSTDSSIQLYLKHAGTEDLQFLTINDYTYIVNRTKTVSMSSTLTDGWGNNDVGDAACAFIQLKKTSNAEQYGFNLYDSSNNTLSTITSATHVKAHVSSTGTIFPLHTRAAGDPTFTHHGTTNYVLDGTCPDIGTQIYTIGRSDETWTDIDQIQDSTGSTIYETGSTAQNFVGGWNTAHARYSAVEYKRPRNLVWRYTVKGVSGGRPDGEEIKHGQDYTCTYSYEVELLHGGENWQKGDTVRFYMESSWLGSSSTKVAYKIEITEVTSVSVKGNIKPCRPKATAFDSQMSVTGSSILGGILNELNDVTLQANESDTSKRITAEVIGNGVYIKRGTGAIGASAKFSIETANTDLMEVMTSEVNDVTKLPTQCKHNYVVKVNNTEAEEDDYYMRFYGTNDQDGPGTWQECARPGLTSGFDPSTMPIQLKRTSTGTFILQEVDWPKRGVGDDSTNGEPSFVGNGINKLLFWRNRICFLSSTNVIASQPGDDNILFPDFWSKTALTISPQDVIDLSASSDNPAFLYDGLETVQGLLLFSENQQFLLTAEAEVLNPETAKLTSQSTYNYNINNPAVSLGTTVGFLDNAGSKSRFFEMANIQRGLEPEIVEQSAVIPNLLPKNIDLITNSRENTFIFFAVSGASDVYGYRYFNSGEKRLQSAWFKWKLRKNLQYHCAIDDTYYAVLDDNNLVKFDLRDEDSTAALDVTIDSSNPKDANFKIHLDSYTSVKKTDMTYNSSSNTTTFSLPSNKSIYDQNTNIKVLDDNKNWIEKPDPDDSSTWIYHNNFGRYGEATVSGGLATLQGDWRTPLVDSDGNDISIYIGYNFGMEVKFPTIYITSGTRESFKADVNASLVVHRLKLALGGSGVYETIIQRKGKPDYTELFESSQQDLYLSNTTPWLDSKIHTIPAYERNTNLTVYLKSTHPSPTTLLSMSWEGDYSNRYYQRA